MHYLKHGVCKPPVYLVFTNITISHDYPFLFAKQMFGYYLCDTKQSQQMCIKITWVEENDGRKLPFKILLAEVLLFLRSALNNFTKHVFILVRQNYFRIFFTMDLRDSPENIAL